MTVKLADIAARTGVGIPTVSHILNATPGRTYRVQTRQRVLDAAQEMGYRANASARAMQAGRFNAIAVVSSASQSGRSWATHAMVTAIETALHGHDMHLVLSALDDATLTADAYVPKILRELLVDGILLNYTHLIPEALVELIEAHRLPVVWLNTTREHDCVFVDNFGGFEAATRRLIELGHRRIAYHGLATTAGDDLHHSLTDRREGYAAAMRAAGLTPRTITTSEVCDASHPMAAALAADDRPTALVCYQIDFANNALYLAARAGLTIGRDLSMVTMSSEADMRMPVPLTRLVACEADRAEAAVSALRAKIARPERRLKPRPVSLHTVDEGASVGPPLRIDSDLGSKRGG